MADMTKSHTASVLVVGAGPVGLALACELARHGTSCRIVDQNDARSTTSKALGVQSRTLEVLYDLGIVDRALAAGRRIHGVNAYADGQRIVHVDLDDMDAPYPFALSLPQSDTERILEERLGELGVAVERGKKLTHLVQDDEGVTATLAPGDEAVRTRWLVGCDGAHSAVRRCLGLSFEGAKYDESFALGDVHIDCALPDDETHAFLSSDGVFVMLPLPGEHLWRVVVDRVAGDPTLESLQELAKKRGATNVRLRDPGWLSGFSIHRRMVPSFRQGRVFLAGDAAHIHSPVGGQGMNTGIQDAYNLAWKLALVDAGAGRDTLLASYDVERRPIAASTLQGTDLATRVVTIRNPIARELRNLLAAHLSSIEIVQQRIMRNAAELTLNYRKSPLVGEDRIALGKSHVVRDPSKEIPTMGDWLDFGAAPRPGDRAPDVELPERRRLFELLRGPHHTLLLFDGAAETPEGYKNLAGIARRVEARAKGHVKTHVVVPRAERPKALDWDGSVVLDVAGAFHNRYGAASECLYLVRPDGYVGYRGQPADEENLLRYLDRIFS
jgi:2-polyprenyl-6-methoxyphenol hydroxylase-like FAD-dependent oxidoreductase